MFKTVIKRVRTMGEASHTILRGGLMIACTLLLCSLALMLAAGPETFDTYYLHGCAAVMRSMAPAVLLVAVIGSAWGESNGRR